MPKISLEPRAATITALTHDGRGIAQIDGKTTFITGALPGEQVLFTYHQRRGKFDEGEVTEVIVSAPERAEPLCQHFKICGGCALQHIDGAAQIKIKQDLLLNQLQHFGGITPEEILPPLVGPIWGYRRKARLSVKYVNKKQTVLVGFHEKKGRYIAELNRCEILYPPLGDLITPLKIMIQDLESYQHIPQIEAAVGDDSLALVFRHLLPLPENDIAKLIAFSQQHKIRLYLQPQGPSSTHLVWPENTSELLNYRLPAYGLTLEFHPTDFAQINATINEQMITRALELLDLKPQDRVLDLFCGVGNFTLPLARHCAEVIGVEGDTILVKRAQQNAINNQLTNVEFYPIDLNTDFATTAWAQKSFNKILLDPPRTGALAAVQQLIKFKAEKIVYVSCNPATLARDAGELVKAGYKLTKTGVMDMFPHTHHVEAIALFER